VVRNISDHPVCASKVASRLFLIAQPSPPPEEGTSSSFSVKGLACDLFKRTACCSRSEERNIGNHNQHSDRNAGKHHTWTVPL
jgi:hypothetical protein